MVPSSYHPPHVFKSILFGQVLRWATHSSTYEDFKCTKAVVQSKWRQQGYSRSKIREAVRNVFKLTLQTPDSWETGFFPCTCFICSFGVHCKFVVNMFNNNTYQIVHRLTCVSVNVIYLIMCKNCKIYYVGQTSRTLSRRISDHVYNIRAFYRTSVSEHFNNGTCTLSDFTFTALEHCPTERKRLQKENQWITRLRTLAPLGLNQELNKQDRLHLVVPYSACSQKVTRFCRTQLRNVINTCSSFKSDVNLRGLLSNKL